MNSIRLNSGRPRSFNEESVLVTIMDAFWANGYADTSYSVLESVTGLKRQSLVYAFGDKKKVFVKALQFYVSKRVALVVEILSSNISFTDKLKKVFALWESDATSNIKNGCLLINTTGELGRKDKEVAEISVKATQSLEAAFLNAIKKAQDNGEIGCSVDAATLARIFIAAGDGALLHSRASGDSEQAKRTFESLLTLVC
jgi:TetR/AcrR family transcriptional repressor of nem operon